MSLNKNGFSLVEVLVSIFLISVVALGGATLGLQAIKSTNRSKVGLLLYRIEADVLDLALNKSSWNQVSIQNKESLRTGQDPLPSLVFDRAGGSQYLVNAFDNASSPPRIYFDMNGDVTDAANPQWVASAEISYRRIRMPPAGANNFPDYAFAYWIETNPSLERQLGSPLRARGIMSGLSNATRNFTNQDFFLPISSMVFSGGSEDYPTDGFAGYCVEGNPPMPVSPNRILGVKSIDWRTGKAQCVLAPAQAQCVSAPRSEQASYAVEVRTEGDNLILDLGTNCLSRKSCTCEEHGTENWVFHSYSKAGMFHDIPGGICGECKFAYEREVNYKLPTGELNANRVYGICPHENYNPPSLNCNIKYDVSYSLNSNGYARKTQVENCQADHNACTNTCATERTTCQSGCDAGPPGNACRTACQATYTSCRSGCGSYGSCGTVPYCGAICTDCTFTAPGNFSNFPNGSVRCDSTDVSNNSFVVSNNPDTDHCDPNINHLEAFFVGTSKCTLKPDISDIRNAKRP